MASMNFTEQQSIPTNWRLLIFGGVTLMMAFVAFMVFKTEWTAMPEKEKPYLLTLLIAPLSTSILFFIRLDIRMSSENFEYKVYPFRNKYKVIPFSKIAQVELLKPKGIKSFKSVGAHQSLNQTELNFGGKYMLRLRLISGRMIAFSTNKPQEIKSFLLNLPEGNTIIKVEI